MSAPTEICPNCEAHFPPKEALVTSGVPVVAGFRLPGVSTLVKCPGCGHLFSAKSIRFFGFLTATHLRIFIAILALCVIVGNVLLFLTTPE